MHDGSTSDRRAFLRLGGAAVLGGLAGCSALSGRSPLDLAVFNWTDTPQTVTIRLLDPDEGPRSDPARYDASLDLEPDGEVRREAVADARRHLVRYRVYEENSRLTDQDHVHYYGDDDETDPTLAFNLREPGVLTRR